MKNYNEIFIKIYYKDTDCGGVVYYANYLNYFEQGRTEWMASKGISIKELADQGILFVVKTAELDYVSPSRYGEVLKIMTAPDKIGGATINFTYEIWEQETDRLIVTGSTRLACINSDMKPVKIPGDVLKAFKG
jgi:acyl-CoA thioester hydrolase